MTVQNDTDALEPSELDIETQIDAGKSLTAKATVQHVTLSVADCEFLETRKFAASEIAHVANVKLPPQPHDNLRDNIGQALSNWLTENAGETMDWFDARNVDALADEAMKVIDLQPRGTDAQILKERGLAAECIMGVIAFGQLGKEYPPDEDAWLRPFYDIGVLLRPQATSTSGHAATRDVLAERQRQINAEGYTAEHDDEHADGSLAFAAAAYAVVGGWPDAPERAVLDQFGAGGLTFTMRTLWPHSWNINFFQPKSRRHDLVRAGALILAEIERLDRASQSKLMKATS